MSSPSRQDRANAIRFLSMDAVQKANSGHPGMPMGMADIAEVLWHDFMQHDPEAPLWPNRDRFVLSNGHGSMLLYSLLYLTGYALTLEDLQQFRQLHSKTPGHPEHAEAPGVETTTGPLGQGLANAVGMAIAERHLAAQFNRDGFPLINHFTYAFVGDGCLMEGISHEVCSLAGTLGLGKLIVFYDDNGISIDGDVKGWFKDNTPERFRAYGWQVIDRVDGHQPEAVKAAIEAAQAETTRPTLICCQTTIGFGSPTLAGSAATHGAPLGDAEIAAIREKLHWPHAPFVIPEDLKASWDAKRTGATRHAAWKERFAAYKAAYPALAAEFNRRMQGELPASWASQADAFLQDTNQKKQSVATRKASQLALDVYANALPELIGGSADLMESNCTNWKGMSVFTAADPAGRYLHYGVREFGMSAIMNGMALYGGLIPFGGTFLTFSDYARNAIRMAALMRQRVVFVYTHDSIGLGEDGPTHQPIEHLPSLRLMPNVHNWRPCDTVETAVAWRAALEYQGPSCLALSRQALPFQSRDEAQLADVARGGYVLLDLSPKATPSAVIIATGSEVALAVEAAHALKAEGVLVRVVSMPCVEVFLSQPASYQASVLPPSLTARVVVEAAATDGWYRFVGLQGRVIGIDRFGASAPAKAVYQACGVTTEAVVEAVKAVVADATTIPFHPHANCASGS